MNMTIDDRHNASDTMEITTIHSEIISSAGSASSILYGLARERLLTIFFHFHTINRLPITTNSIENKLFKNKEVLISSGIILQQYIKASIKALT